MITDLTLDEALIEIMRTKKALEALRRVRKEAGFGRLKSPNWQVDRECQKQHAAAKRASMDLTRCRAKLRAGK